MKRILAVLSCAAGLFLSEGKAEQLIIYASASMPHSIPRSAVSPAPEGSGEVTLTLRKKGPRLGSIDTGSTPMLKIATDAKAAGGAPDAAGGKGPTYLAEDDAGHVFVIYFECDPASEKLKKGSRAAIVQADDLGSNRTVFVGEISRSWFSDEAIVRQLQEITDHFQAKKPGESGKTDEAKK